jgi:hypothetical protein
MIKKTSTALMRILLLACAAAALQTSPTLAAAPAKAKPAAAASEDTGKRDAEDLALFERKAQMAKDLGATYMNVTDGLPEAFWELDADDPYPAWFSHHAGLFIIFPAKDVEPYVDMKYARHVQAILTQRCAVLKKYDLKGVWRANEPAVLPESFFTAYPQLRGPRIDQPNRSRKIYYAPNVDEPETLRMYRDSMQSLLKTCPEVAQFNWTTTDAGSGFDWSPSLYPGINGNSNYRDKPMADRVAGFLINAQKAAKDAGYDVEINVNPIAPRQWMIPTFSPDVLENILRRLPAGLAVQGRQNPEVRAPSVSSLGGLGNGGAFAPVVGLAIPSFDAGGGGGRRGGSGNAGAANGTANGPVKLQIDLGDAASMDFNYRLAKTTKGMPMRTLSQRLTALRAFAVTEVGEDQADNLLEAWSALNDVKQNLDVLDFGGMLRFGHVLNRWINRPMVPFPADLTDAEKADYRAFIFQAKGEDQANDLIDIQAMRMYEGYGAKLLFQRDIETALPRAQRALGLFGTIRDAQSDPAKKAYWDLTAKRTQALIYLMISADDMVAYQAQLDRVKQIGAKPETDPVLGVQSGWDRTDLMETARKEIDNTVNLQRLLQSTSEPILDLAPTQGEETIMHLGPNLIPQLKHKIDTMNAHWRDYDRLFTVPNP